MTLVAVKKISPREGTCGVSRYSVYLGLLAVKKFLQFVLDSCYRFICVVDVADNRFLLVLLACMLVSGVIIVLKEQFYGFFKMIAMKQLADLG